MSREKPLLTVREGALPNQAATATPCEPSEAGGEQEDDGEGLRVNFHRSKTDQAGEGASLYMPLAGNPQVCAVRAVRAWLEAAEIAEGALMRSIVGHSHRRGAPFEHASLPAGQERAVPGAGLNPASRTNR